MDFIKKFTFIASTIMILVIFYLMVKIIAGL
jgi:hypothetical protein